MAGAGISRQKPNVPDPLAVDSLTARKKLFLLNQSANIDLAADQDNWNPAELADNIMLAVNPTIANVDITGMAAQTVGAIIGIRNVHPTNKLTLTNQDGQSAAANQFKGPNLSNLVLNPGESAIWRYDSVTPLWEVFATAVAATAAGEINTAANVGAGIGLLFRDKTGVVINIKTLVQGANITLTNNADSVQIDASGGLGTANLEWRFDNSIISADPGSGDFRLNNADRTLATEIFISDTTNPGLDATKLLEALSANDEIYIQQSDDSTAAVLYSVSGAVQDNGAWFTVPVTFQSEGATAFTNNKNCAVIFLYNSGSGGGENNTASNVGTGLGKPFKQKVGVDLQYRSVQGGIATDARNDGDNILLNAQGANEFPAQQFEYLWDTASMSRIPQQTIVDTDQEVLNIGPKGDKWSQRGLLDAAAVITFATPIGETPDGPGLHNDFFDGSMGSEVAWQHPNVDFQALTAFTIYAGWVRTKIYSQSAGTLRLTIMRQGNIGANTNMITIESVQVFNSPGNQTCTIEATIDLNTGREVLSFQIPDARIWSHVVFRVSLALIELVIDGVVVDSATPAAASYAITNTAGDWLEWFGSDLGVGVGQIYGDYGRYHGISEHYWTFEETLESFNYRDGPNVPKNGSVLNWWFNQPGIFDRFSPNQREYHCILNSGPADVTKRCSGWHNKGFVGKYQAEYFVQNTGANPIADLMLGCVNDISPVANFPGATADGSGLLLGTGQVFVNNAVVATLAGGAVVKGETIVHTCDIDAAGNVTEVWDHYDSALVFVDSVSNTRNGFSTANSETLFAAVGRTTNAISDNLECRFAPKDMTVPLKAGFEAWTTGGEGQGIVPVPRVGISLRHLIAKKLDAQTIATGIGQVILFNTALGNFGPDGLDTVTGIIKIPAGIRAAAFDIAAMASLSVNDGETVDLSIVRLVSGAFGGLAEGIAGSQIAAGATAIIGLAIMGQAQEVNGGDEFEVFITHSGGGNRALNTGLGATQIIFSQIS